MVLGLAKWGKKFIREETAMESCPFSSDHPKLQEFMGESLRDRKNLRNFLEDINGKVNGVSLNIGEMKGKLDLLLQGARVRWNAGLIPPDVEKKL
jgi:hypothetical protein